MNDLLQDVLNGDVRALARVISRVEDRSPGSIEILQQLFPHTGKARVIGITGSPGSGKSSLVDRLALAYRQRGNSLGIVAVDPSSPFTGGAILGDRIRMSSLATDPGVFIRSMATRGNLGGLAAATADVVSVLDAASRDPVLVETVGVGQDEIDIVKLADVSVVVLVPGMGDDIQALKAGIMEIGDIFVINKCDRPGVEKMEHAVLALLSLAHRPDGWIPPVVKTVATEGQGIEELLGAIDHCYAHFQNADLRLGKKREAARQRLLTLLRERLMLAAVDANFQGDELGRLVDRIVRREEDPYGIVDRIVRSGYPSPAASRHPLPLGEGKIDHVGIAVKSLAEAIRMYEDVLGLKVSGYEVVEDQGVRLAMVPVGESRFELLEPMHGESPVGKFIAKRGEGIHHIAICVDNIEEALERFKSAGARLIDAVPRRGAHNTKVAFIHPSSTHGVLLELVEHDK